MTERPTGPTLARGESGEVSAAGGFARAGGPARRWGKRLINLALLVVVTWALYRSIGQDLADLDRSDFVRWRPRALPLTGSALLLIAVYLTHAMLWRRIVSDLIGRRLAIGPALRIYFLANLGRYIPGRFWQVAGMAVLAGRAGIPVVGAIAASALAQLSFLLSGTLFLIALIPVWRGPGYTIAALAGCVTLIALSYWGLATDHGAALRERLGTRLGPRFATALDTVGRVQPRDGLAWLGGYAFSWILLGGAFAIFTIAFVPSAAAEIRYLAGTMAAGYLSGYLAIFAPAGMGVREGVLAALLARVVPGSAAILISGASRIWFTITELIVLLVIPFLPRAVVPGNGGEPVEDVR